MSALVRAAALACVLAGAVSPAIAAGEPGWVMSISPRSATEDRTNPVNPKFAPNLLSISKEVFARGIHTGSKLSCLDYMAKTGLTGKAHAPASMQLDGIWTIRDPGSYKLGLRAHHPTSGMPLLAGTRIVVDGIDAAKGNIEFGPDAQDPPPAGGMAMQLGAGDHQIGWSLTCVGADPNVFDGLKADADYDRQMFYGTLLPYHSNAYVSPKELFGMELELVYSKDGGPWQPIPESAITHDQAKTPKSAAAPSVASAGELNDGFMAGWVVEGLRSKQGFNDPRDLWLEEDDRYGVEWVLPTERTAKSTWTSRDHVQAKLGEPRPYLYRATSKFAAFERGAYVFALEMSKANPGNKDSNWVQAGARLTIGSQEVFGPLGSTDIVIQDGVGVLMGTINIAEPGRYKAVLRMAASNSNVSRAAHSVNLMLKGDGTFRDDEQGIVYRLKIKGPSDDRLRAIRPGEFFVEKPAK